MKDLITKTQIQFDLIDKIKILFGAIPEIEVRVIVPDDIEIKYFNVVSDVKLIKKTKSKFTKNKPDFGMMSPPQIKKKK